MVPAILVALDRPDDPVTFDTVKFVHVFFTIPLGMIVSTDSMTYRCFQVALGREGKSILSLPVMDSTLAIEVLEEVIGDFSNLLIFEGGNGREFIEKVLEILTELMPHSERSKSICLITETSYLRRELCPGTGLDPNEGIDPFGKHLFHFLYCCGGLP